MIRASLAKTRRVPRALTLISPQLSGEGAMQKPVVILVGGFLGAGKTTLLARAAERLTSRASESV